MCPLKILLYAIGYICLVKILFYVHLRKLWKVTDFMTVKIYAPQKIIWAPLILLNIFNLKMCPLSGI